MMIPLSENDRRAAWEEFNKMHQRKLDPHHEKLIRDLNNSDQKSGGKPTLPSDIENHARGLLEKLMVDIDLLINHVDVLVDLQPKFVPPVSRRLLSGAERIDPKGDPRFRHNEFLPDETKDAICTDGMRNLTNEQVAKLLLNPYALYDLGDHIDMKDSPYWRPHKNAEGRRLTEKFGIKMEIPGFSPQQNSEDTDD